MKRRFLWVLLAVALPVVSVVLVTRMTLPAIIPAVAEKATSKLPAAQEVAIPATLDEAKALTKQRLRALQEMSQPEWDVERARIPHKHPPRTIDEAVARAEQRLNDLGMMKPEDWEGEKARIRARNRGD